ncbi:hypothetical protein EVU96_09085 [Bacillus infantis]|uniref:hypothetical protein n=1 Tax=Bacillus infantis TaxID=324767 RepID=UPI00101CF566|nr:hypothetical protein [Bacillus infantis]RYI30559.1 hypothetical protein EVU96_09085 [Bacillus infantis]
MRTKKLTTIEKTILLPESITCNKCGKKAEISGDEYDREFQSNVFQSIKLQFAYGSKYDMDVWEFDLCEECVTDYVSSFKYKPLGFEEFE